MGTNHVGIYHPSIKHILIGIALGTHDITRTITGSTNDITSSTSTYSSTGIVVPTDVSARVKNKPIKTYFDGEVYKRKNKRYMNHVPKVVKWIKK